MSFENLFMVNGVTVNENLRGQALDLYIEDAIQETTIATAGVSAEYGRFGGGVVNIDHQVGRQLFSGSFRDTLDQRQLARAASSEARHGDPIRATTRKLDDDRADARVHVRRTDRAEIGCGSSPPAASRSRSSTGSSVDTNIPYTVDERAKRYEGKGTYSLDVESPVPGQLHQGDARPAEQHVQHRRRRWT